MGEKTKTRYSLTVWFCKLIPRDLPKYICSLTDRYQMFITALFMRAPAGKSPGRLAISRRADEQPVVYPHNGILLNNEKEK